MMPTAVITGCNEGIGFWFAREALKQVLQSAQPCLHPFADII
jgi:NAD(P)-dependent dehydrogenase (short-subunit alcohol dehydrogenase family)